MIFAVIIMSSSEGFLVSGALEIHLKAIECSTVDNDISIKAELTKVEKKS